MQFSFIGRIYRRVIDSSFQTMILIGYFGFIVFIWNGLSLISDIVGLQWLDPYRIFMHLTPTELTRQEKFLLLWFGIFAASVVASNTYTKNMIYDSMSDVKRTMQLVDVAHSLGIRRMWRSGEESVKRWRELRSRARRLYVLTVSGYIWTYHNKDLFADIIGKNRGHMRIILAHPESSFVHQRQMREGPSRAKLKAIENEIALTLQIFEEIIGKVEREYGTSGVGSVEIRFLKGDFPCRLEIVDEKIIHWTPHIIHERTIFTPVFEVDVIDSNSLGKTLLDMFSRLWKESEPYVELKWPYH